MTVGDITPVSSEYILKKVDSPNKNDLIGLVSDNFEFISRNNDLSLDLDKEIFTKALISIKEELKASKMQSYLIVDGSGTIVTSICLYGSKDGLGDKEYAWIYNVSTTNNPSDKLISYIFNFAYQGTLNEELDTIRLDLHWLQTELIDYVSRKDFTVTNLSMEKRIGIMS